MLNRSNWKLNLIAGGLVLAAFTASAAAAQIHVYIGGAPPPLRYEVRTASPGVGFVWTEGYWGDDGGRYVWHVGVWQRPPFEGASWSHPHYDHYQQGWQMHEGHWDHEDHDTHHDYSHDKR